MCHIAGLLESDDPKDALDGFASVIQMEKEKGEWCGTFAPPLLRALASLPGPASPDRVTACKCSGRPSLDAEAVSHATGASKH